MYLVMYLLNIQVFEYCTNFKEDEFSEMPV